VLRFERGPYEVGIGQSAPPCRGSMNSGRAGGAFVTVRRVSGAAKGPACRRTPSMSW
jgi:hypothetical protein